MCWHGLNFLLPLVHDVFQSLSPDGIPLIRYRGSNNCCRLSG